MYVGFRVCFYFFFVLQLLNDVFIVHLNSVSRFLVSLGPLITLSLSSILGLFSFDLYDSIYFGFTIFLEFVSSHILLGFLLISESLMSPLLCSAWSSMN